MSTEVIAILVGGLFVLIALILAVMYPYPNRMQKYATYAFLWIGAIALMYGFIWGSSPTAIHTGTFEKRDK